MNSWMLGIKPIPKSMPAAAVRNRLKEQLRIYPKITNRNRRFFLTPPDARRPDYSIRFCVPRDIRASHPNLPMVVFRSTGTTVRAAAKTNACAIIEDIFEGRWEQADKRKLASGSATVGEILDAYLPDARTVKGKTAGRNKNMLQLVIAEATGKVNVRELRAADVLTGKLLRDWFALRLKRVAGLDLVQQERAAITMNSTLLQARSVLALKVAHLYADLKMPDLTEFRAVRKLRVDKDVSYKPLPQICLDAIEADARLLKGGKSKVALASGVTPEEQLQVYKVYLLMSRLGLRNVEVTAAREHWIERDGAAAEFVIARRPDFVAKNKRYGRLRIDPELLAELDATRGLPDAWIITAATMTARFDLCNRKINHWLRNFMPPDREKCAYELRKHAGSIIVSRPESEGGGLVAAASFLRDTIATAEKHYASYLRQVRGIRSSEISFRVLPAA